MSYTDIYYEIYDEDSLVKELQAIRELLKSLYIGRVY